MSHRLLPAASCGLALLLITWAGCSARRSEPVLGHMPAAAADEAHGRRVFMQYCHACHPGGEAGLGPALNNKPLPRTLIAFQTRHGLGAMPSFNERELSDADLAALTDYLVALRRSD